MSYSQITAIGDRAKNDAVTVRALGANYPQDYVLDMIAELATAIVAERGATS